MNFVKSIAFFLFLSPLLSFAQTYFQPGILVTAQGDTLRGQIEYREWESSPKKIVFQADGSSAPKTYTAGEIRFFSVNVGHLAAFESYAGPISTNNIDVNKIANGRDTSFRMDTVFLRIVQDGKHLKLFSYTDVMKTRFFIAENFSDKPVELIYRVYWNSQETSADQRTTFETAFKGQLYDEAVKASVITPALKQKIKDAEYDENDILKITSIINNLNPADVNKNNVAKPGKLRTTLVIVGIAGILVWLIHDFATVK